MKRILALVVVLTLVLSVFPAAFALPLLDGVDIAAFSQLYMYRAISGNMAKIEPGSTVWFVTDSGTGVLIVGGWVLEVNNKTFVIEKAQGFFELYPDNPDKTSEEITFYIPGLSVFEYPEHDTEISILKDGYALKRTNNRFNQALGEIGFSYFMYGGEEIHLYDSELYRFTIKKVTRAEDGIHLALTAVLLSTIK